MGRYLTLVILFAVGTQAAAADAVSPDEAAVRKAVASYVNAFNSADAKAVAAHWTQSGEFVTPAGKTLKGRDAIQKEFEAYQRLEGLPGVPACHGMVDGRFLVIEYIRGTPYREADWSDRGLWFEKFLKLLISIHERGVSHGDLKSKSNIMVTEDEQPCVIDFGTAFVSRPGFHPLNNWLFRHARQMDINAWVKHKYHGRYEDASEEDLERLNYSFIEYIARIFNRRPMRAIPRKK